MNWHSPFPADVVECQIKQLARGLVDGERTAVFNDFAQAHVNRFDSIGGVPQGDFPRGVITLRISGGYARLPSRLGRELYRR